MNKNFKVILTVEIVIAFIVVVALLANREPSVVASPQPSPSITQQQQSDLVESCTSFIVPKTSNEQWQSPPKLNLNDERKFWNIDTNCGEIVIEVFADKAPIAVNSLRFLTDQKYYDATPCHRLTTSRFFVIQCGDPLGTGIGNSGYSIMEENLPEAGSNNYPEGTVALAKSNQPNSSGAQFFIVYKDTTLGPSYSIVGRVLSGLEVVKSIAEAGVVGGVGDGKPNQNFGIIEATFTQKLPKKVRE